MSLVRSRCTRLLLPVVTVVIAALGLTGCAPVLQITTDPSLYPGFSRDIVDYVDRCDPSTPTKVSVNAPAGTTVSVNGKKARSGSFTTDVDQTVGRRFTIDVTLDGVTTNHNVRCLPTDFPAWSAERTGVPQAQYYSTMLLASIFLPAYAVVFDTNGVPVWWLKQQLNAVLWSRLPNGHFATVLSNGRPMQEYDLEGKLVREVSPVDGPSDWHDAILLPNGNYVLATAQAQACDLTAWGLSGDRTCIDHVLQELTPAGSLVWSWDAAAHIPVTETPARWRTFIIGGAYDPWHYNSVEDTGDAFVLSFRHTDAVYKVAKSDGAITWKIGGTARPESLQVIGDDVFTNGGSFSGQHDARLTGGVLTLHDNGTGIRAPRALGYRIDEEAGTATLAEVIRDSRYTDSGCCGSARRLPGGNWVAGWGASNMVTELQPDGTPVFTLTHNGIVYRGLPILPGELDATALRAGMDVQYPK